MRTTALSLTLSLALVVIFDLPAIAGEDWAPGEKLTFVNCGRCHVIGERNRMGGISSTPSFMAIRAREGWEENTRSFWALNPHPAFTQIESVTEPFPVNRPSPIHPIRLTLDEVDEIVGYMRSIEPADLGAGVGIR